MNTVHNVLLRLSTESDSYSIIPVNHPIKPVNVVCMYLIKKMYMYMRIDAFILAVLHVFFKTRFKTYELECIYGVRITLTGVNLFHVIFYFKLEKTEC